MLWAHCPVVLVWGPPAVLRLVAWLLTPSRAEGRRARVCARVAASSHPALFSAWLFYKKSHSRQEVERIFDRSLSDVATVSILAGPRTAEDWPVPCWLAPRGCGPAGRR